MLCLYFSAKCHLLTTCLVAVLFAAFVLFVFMLVLMCFCVATVFLANKDLYIIAEWLVCWTLRRSRAWVQIAAATLSGNSLRQAVHTHRASVHQAAKLVAALLRFRRATAGLAKSSGSLPPGL